jgi:hypothetical protein
MGKRVCRGNFPAPGSLHGQNQCAVALGKEAAAKGAHPRVASAQMTKPICRQNDRTGQNQPTHQSNGKHMNMLLTATPLAAIGFSLIYLLFGGGLGGAVLIFIIAKMFGK